MPTGRGFLAAAGVDGKLYVVGGADLSGPIETLEIYDPEIDSWSSGPPLSAARHDLAATALDGNLYAVGGRYHDGEWRYLTTLEIYDPETNAWSNGPSMPTARGFLAASMANGSLYAVGGARNVSVLSTLEIYDP